MSLIAIAVLGIVLGFTWRLLRLAFRIALLIALVAAIANYARTCPRTLTRHHPRCNTAANPHADDHARLNPGAAGRLRESDERWLRTVIPVCQLAVYRLMSPGHKRPGFLSSSLKGVR